MFVTSTNIPTFDYGKTSKDKYPINNVISNYKIIGSELCHGKERQICCLLLFTKKFPQNCFSSTLKGKVFPKYTPIPKWLANLLKFKIHEFNELNYDESVRHYRNKFQIKSSKLVTKLFYFTKLILSGDIELNPGPKGVPIIALNTYNARGLKNRLKLKRLLNSCHKIVNDNRNAIIFLQETHLDDGDIPTIELMWRHKFLISPGTNRQCGCLILFDPSWEVIKSEIDGEGRFCLLILKKFDSNIILSNIYAPNDHNLNFFSFIFNKLIESQTSFPDSDIILAGDFNFVMTDLDSANRQVTNSERQCRELVKRNLDRLDLCDTYRIQHQQQGFTWSRGDCMSRLDMIFVTGALGDKLIDTKVDWTFDDSDHAMVEARFKVTDQFPRGPGLFKVDADILDHEESLAQIKTELEHQISQIPETWNPHFKLDFIKSALRSIIAVSAGKKRKIDNLDLQAITEQINTLNTVKEKLVTGEITNPNLLANINQSLKSLEEEHKTHLNELSKKLSIRAKSKWFEDGERSNKYFLNIIKKRTQQSLITKLVTSDGTLNDQESIIEHVTQFYTDLYNEKETETNYDDLLSDCPTLNDSDRATLDREITLEELEKVIKICGDTAPGPDGIPYKVYRKLWTQTGPFLLDSWKYSKSIGLLPYDQRLSIITLLPKEGKDPQRIENWRPITLTNCDLKIFTKLMSDRVAGVLDKLIHPCQTAYIPGRVVHDNLRVFEFYNNYCKENNIDALLISLDAKKAFDSVSHKYMHKVLASYGFSEEFIDTVKLLYNNIQAQILVNGYKSVIIKILRSVKQGDALSCALFILCIDPLIRKIDANPNIKPVQVRPSRYSDIKINNKVCGFADDIGLAVNNDSNTISNIFKVYKLFSKLSGIELNLDKTEILCLQQDTTNQPFVPTPINVEGNLIMTRESIKICGMSFATCNNISYERNIIDKIKKMEKQLIIWLQRALSVEGKNLIVKTFGLSQLIYSLQMSDIKENELIEVERMIFKFLWNKKWVGSTAPDRIKRNFLKLPFEKGGLCVPDIRILNASLKVKQFLRAMKSKHPINLIQKYQLERSGYFEYYKCEYSRISKTDVIVKEYQLACNKLTDNIRSMCNVRPLPETSLIMTSIDVIASTDVLEYLHRKKYLLLIQRYARLANLGVISFLQLLNESRFPRSDEVGELASYIIKFFPEPWGEIVLLKEDINCEITYENEFPAQNHQLVSHNCITVKILRQTLLENFPIPFFPYMNHEKFQLDYDHQHNPFVLIRKAIHAPRDKFFKYRILHGDIFCNERMFRFKMVDSPFCPFCVGGSIETIKHLLWECPRSGFVWDTFSTIINRSYNLDYINYTTVVLGSQNPILVIESLILALLKLIVTKDRTNVITTEMIHSQIKTQFILEKNLMRKVHGKFRKRWERLGECLVLGDM